MSLESGRGKVERRKESGSEKRGQEENGSQGEEGDKMVREKGTRSLGLWGWPQEEKQNCVLRHLISWDPHSQPKGLGSVSLPCFTDEHMDVQEKPEISTKVTQW